MVRFHPLISLPLGAALARAWLQAMLWLGISAGLSGCDLGEPSATQATSPLTADDEGVYHVYPGQEIQTALNRAADDPLNKTVRVHAGTYRPERQAQAFIWLNRRHDGITLEAEGEVILTAVNEQVADFSQGFPAVVNHVVYFGDGISPQTILRGFRITGANHFVTEEQPSAPMEPALSSPGLEPSMFFYTDGGGIKIYGRSYPTILDTVVYDNYASPCGAGVSVEHRNFNEQSATFRNCIFRGNRCQITGSAVDLLPGSAAVLENCLFVGNISNTGQADVGTPADHNGDRGSGALTVFRGSRVTVKRCTFTGNWNGADDKGQQNVYSDTIFWQNNTAGGILSGPRYELDILDASRVSGCFLGGGLSDPRGVIDETRNQLSAPDPDFDAKFRPRNPAYAQVGYRPRN